MTLDHAPAKGLSMLLLHVIQLTWSLRANPEARENGRDVTAGTHTC